MKPSKRKQKRMRKQFLKFLKGVAPYSGVADFNDGHGTSIFYMKRTDNYVRLGIYDYETKILRDGETVTAQEMKSDMNIRF